MLCNDPKSRITGIPTRSDATALPVYWKSVHYAKRGEVWIREPRSHQHTDMREFTRIHRFAKVSAIDVGARVVHSRSSINTRGFCKTNQSQSVHSHPHSLSLFLFILVWWSIHGDLVSRYYSCDAAIKRKFFRRKIFPTTRKTVYIIEFYFELIFKFWKLIGNQIQVGNDEIHCTLSRIIL